MASSALEGIRIYTGNGWDHPVINYRHASYKVAGHLDRFFSGIGYFKLA